MTISEMHDWFDILQDKFNAPYFIDTEKDQFINRAQLELINDIVYRQLFPSVRGGERGPVTLSSIESSITGTEILQPLICVDRDVSTDSTLYQVIYQEDINMASVDAWSGTTTYVIGDLVSLSGVGYYCIQGHSNQTPPNVTYWAPIDLRVMHILSLETAGSTFTSGRFVRFVRHNDYIRLKQNQFRAPSDRNPVYRLTDVGIIVEGATPLSASEDFKITVLRYPLEVDITNSISCELPDFAHDKIIAISLEFAGIATRDEALAAMNQIKEVQEAPPSAYRNSSSPVV